MKSRVMREENVKAVTVVPGTKAPSVLRDLAEPDAADGKVQVATLPVGLCGADTGITSGEYEEALAGSPILFTGHENLGRVPDAPAGSGLSAGDLVVGIVCRPDPVQCAACAAGQWDMCHNGRYTEHAFGGPHAFARERYRVDPEALVRVPVSLVDVGVLLEPMTIVAKARQYIDATGSRDFFTPRTAVATGAGPVGLLAAVLGVQLGLDVSVFDRVTAGPKPGLVRDLGGTYQSESLTDSDVKADMLVECTGVVSVVLETLAPRALDSGEAVFGSVNANRSHYDAAVRALEKADSAGLQRLTTRRVALGDFRNAVRRRGTDVKVVLEVKAG